MDVGAWLKDLGLGEYEAAFRDNAIDGDVLPSLTAEDLKDLGVTIVGHRRKLLDAIAALSASRTAAAAPETTHPPAASIPAPSFAPPQRPAGLAAERRPVTVLFCDLVGSTALAAGLDAEDWRDLVGAYLDAASDAVTQYGGHVLKKLGDGLMALFGYPKAQENDAERAARAALAILAALEALNRKNEGKGIPRLAARVGLDAGPVVVDATGEVFGETPNVAARAQGAAKPGQALATFAVQRQIAGLFVVEDKGAHALKGVPEPVALYRLLRRLGARSLTPFVGRGEDLALLLRRFERARTGEGQFVQIVGEPGLGKSRLVEEFRARLGETPHTWVEWSASQLLQNTPLHPLADWGRQRFGGAEVAPEKRFVDLEQALAQVRLDLNETAPLLAPLLDIPVPEGRTPTLAPDETRRRQLAAVVAWILAGARAQPLVVAFEDLHWADPTTLDLMKGLAERGASAPLFVVATARPEFRPLWTARSHHGVVSLVPLDRAEIRAMVSALAERHALGAEVVDGVAERTGGVPLFVEEVTRLLLERGEGARPQAIPPTLQQLLAARLDRLGDAREVAQIGAVLGREFSYGHLRSVAAAPVAAVADRGGGHSENALQAALETLAEADLLFVEGHAPDSCYRFKHALIQDAAYDSLLESRRQALHRRAAEALVAEPDTQAELVAHHFTQAGDADLAIEWWGKAGDAALSRSAFQEAIAHLGKAIALADSVAGSMGETHATSARLKLQTDYGKAVMWSKGYGAGETTSAFVTALQRASAADPASRFAAHYGVYVGSLVRGDFTKAHETAVTFLREAETEDHAPSIARACNSLGYALLMLGDISGAGAQLERALTIYDFTWDTEARFGAAAEVGVSATAFLSLTSWLRGDVAWARELIEQAVNGANQSEHGTPPRGAAL